MEVDRFARSQRYRIERQLQEGTLLPPDMHIEMRALPPITDPTLVEDTKQRLLCVLCIVNGSILVLSAVLGYFLAGKTLKPIADMMDEQNQFITDASHEFRTPLTSLKSSIEVNLRDKFLTLDHAKKLLKENITEVNKLQLLSDELLKLSQYEKPHSVTVKKLCKISDIAEKAVHRIEASAKQKSIKVIDKTHPISFQGNPYDLTDLLVILLDNALKYSSAKKNIIICDGKNDNSITLSVSDQGIGIDKEDIPHIFDRFYRADTSRMRDRDGGYGLGLAIAKKIVDSHHGTIWVESAVGKGSTFFVRLPVKHNA